MQTHLPWKELGYSVAGLALLVGLYVGAYGVSVGRENELRNIAELVPERRQTLVEGEIKVTEVVVERTVCIATATVVPTYPAVNVLGPETVRSFFAPVHDIDRRLRSEFWKDQLLPTASY